jgi:serine/threonine protein kinase
VLRSDPPFTQPVTSPWYCPPEWLTGGAPTCSGDIWSIGAVLAELALGYPIFGQETDADGLQETEADTFRTIKATLRSNVLENLIRNALHKREPPDDIEVFINLLRRMLVQNPEERLAAKDIDSHPFMTCA